MFRKTSWIVMFPAATLSGCAYSSSDTLVSMSDNTASSIFIKEIAVKISAPDAPAELADVVRSRLRKELKKCATGDRPARLDVTIAVFSGANPGRKILSDTPSSFAAPRALPIHMEKCWATTISSSHWALPAWAAPWYWPTAAIPSRRPLPGRCANSASAIQRKTCRNQLVSLPEFSFLAAMVACKASINFGADPDN